VLIDASFREESRRRSFLDAARGWGIAAALIHCHAEPGVVAERLARRRGDASDAVWTTYLEAARRWEEPDTKTRRLTRTIDTGGDLARSHAAALEVLREFNLLNANG
jgi:predicted kinase